MNCNICNGKSRFIFNAKVLGKHEARYFSCSRCNFLQVEDPFWLAEAYQDPINVLDTGILKRNMELAKLTATLLFYLFDEKARYLDYAGGYGIFTRLMRDIGFDYYWNDPYATNLLARGFAYLDHTGDIELITSFESFEHFERPLEELEKMLGITENILFTTVLLPDPVPEPDTWWYYAHSHGQHISFYSGKTLQFIADRYGLQLSTNRNNIHLFSNKPIGNTVFRLILKLHDPWLFSLVKKNMKSRTDLDMESLQAEEKTPPKSMITPP